MGKKCGVMTSVVMLIYKNSQGMCKECLQFQYGVTNVSFPPQKSQLIRLRSGMFTLNVEVTTGASWEEKIPNLNE